MISHKGLSIVISRNVRWIVACFFFGACIFLLWPVSSSDETEIFIPVDVGKIPQGLTVTDLPLQGIEVRVRGPKSAIETLSNLKLRYTINLSDAHAGVKVVPINHNRIPLPKEISILEVKPSFLTVRIEKEINKQLPVIISFSGKPASGYFVSDAVAKPSAVILRGAEHILDPIDKAVTKPIDVTGLSESFKKEIALDLAEGLEIPDPSKIIIGEIVIAEKVVTRKFHDIAVGGKNTRYAFNITPPVITIEVKGPVNTLEKLHTDKGLHVFVDLKDLKPGVYVRRAAMTLPVKATLVGVNPEIFTVKITESKIGKRKQKNYD